MGRFLSVDPITREYPYYSPYHFAGNTPIWASDLDGLEPKYSNNDKEGDSQTVNGIEYKYSKGDWRIGAVGLPYQSLVNAAKDLSKTLNQNSDVKSVLEDSYVGGEFTINGIPFGVQAYGDFKFRFYTGKSFNFSPGGLTLGGLDIHAYGMELTLDETEGIVLRRYSEETATLFMFQLERYTRHGETPDFNIYFGANFNQGNFSLNLRTNIQKHSKAIVQAINSLDPSIARKQYLQGRLDMLGRSKIKTESEEVVYRKIRYIIHWQKEANDWKMYQFDEGTPAFENLSKRPGANVYEKYIKY